MRDGSSSSPWRARNPDIPSLNDSSEPVETSSTRAPVSGSSRSRCASAITAPTAVRLSLAPGTTAREAMSAITAIEPSDSASPARTSRATPAAAPAAIITGPSQTANMIGAVCVARS